MYHRKWGSKKKLCYYKAKTRKLDADKAKNTESDPSLLLKLEDLKEQAKFLENEKLFLKEQLDNFKSNKIQLFKKGQYSNSTSTAYQDLISYAGVSANKVDKVVDIVLTQIAGTQVDRLPKSTFAMDMAIESREVAQYQIASELSGNCTNMTLNSDGTTKHGRSYTTFDVINEQGKLLVCGLREVGAADAQS